MRMICHLLPHRLDHSDMDHSRVIARACSTKIISTVPHSLTKLKKASLMYALMHSLPCSRVTVRYSIFARGPCSPLLFWMLAHLCCTSTFKAPMHGRLFLCPFLHPTGALPWREPWQGQGEGLCTCAHPLHSATWWVVFSQFMVHRIVASLDSAMHLGGP